VSKLNKKGGLHSGKPPFRSQISDLKFQIADLNQIGGLNQIADLNQNRRPKSESTTLIRIMSSYRITRTRGLSFAVLIAQDSFSRKLNLVAFFADTFDQDLLSFLQLIANILHSAICDLGDVK
jgi:hypothetical protein